MIKQTFTQCTLHFFAVGTQKARDSSYGSEWLPPPAPAPSSMMKATPRIVSGDQLFRAQLGETLVLPCQVANLNDFVLMWKQGSRVLTAQRLVVRKDPRLMLRDDHSLVITNLKPEDQGTYTCEVDVMGKPESIRHTVS